MTDWSFDIAALNSRQEPILAKIKGMLTGEEPVTLYWYVDSWCQSRRGEDSVDEADIVCWMPMPMVP